MTILVTGSAGLIGRGIVRRLRGAGIAVREFDLRISADQDTRDPMALRTALQEVSGVIHLAAISRVVWAERNPLLADRVNVGALRSLIDIMSAMRERPWLIFASSREVYGEQHQLPVAENAALRPMNHYARTKLAGEQLVEAAQRAGLPAAICRFSNVFGSSDDHADRVAVAFARAAAFGGEIVVEGGNNSFDFTFADDVVHGLHLLTNKMIAGEVPPPLHFVSGRSMSLYELADLARGFARRPLRIREGAPRNFDVSRFYGDPARAQQLLNWKATTSLENGFGQLVREFVEYVPDIPRPWLEDLLKTHASQFSNAAAS